MAKRKTTEQFVAQAREIHGDRYDYSRVDYKNTMTKVEIICPEHGPFWQVPDSHLHSHGCPGCSGNRRLTIKSFKKKALSVHANKYDYSKVRYKNNNTKVVIICPEHGVFKQAPATHLAGKGCPECSKKIKIPATRIKHTGDKFVPRALSVHGDRYDYSMARYKGACINVEIICPEHGSFWQAPHNHLRGAGCPQCGRERGAETRRHSHDYFFNRFSALDLNDKFEVLSEYKGASEHIDLQCKTCGYEFSRLVSNLFKQQSCPRCAAAGTASKFELEVLDFVKSIYQGKIIHGEPRLIAPMELDVYLPDLNLAIEVNGIYTHSVDSHYRNKTKTYHKDKSDLCAEKGVLLLHIWEHQWGEIWKSMLRARLGKVKTVGARQCEVVTLDHKQSQQFLIENHLQGPVPASIRLGLVYKNELVSVMTLGRSRFSVLEPHELLRFCNKRDTRVIGAASRLLKHSGITDCISYANRNWSDGKLYRALGFKQVHVTQPNYYYFHKSDRLTVYSRNRFQKHKLESVLERFDPELSEVENMLLNGYRRIFDAGNILFLTTSRQ